MNLAAAK